MKVCWPSSKDPMKTSFGKASLQMRHFHKTFAMGGAVMAQVSRVGKCVLAVIALGALAACSGSAGTSRSPASSRPPASSRSAGSSPVPTGTAASAASSAPASGQVRAEIAQWARRCESYHPAAFHSCVMGRPSSHAPATFFTGPRRLCESLAVSGTPPLSLVMVGPTQAGATFNPGGDALGCNFGRLGTGSFVMLEVAVPAKGAPLRNRRCSAPPWSADTGAVCKQVGDGEQISGPGDPGMSYLAEVMTPDGFVSVVRGYSSAAEVPPAQARVTVDMYRRAAAALGVLP